jgi:hypothetical protein
MFYAKARGPLMHFFRAHPTLQCLLLRLRLAVRVTATLLVILGAVCLGFFPAVTTARLAFSSSLRQTGQFEELGEWFHATQRRYDRWAASYRSSGYAAKVSSGNVAGTEWPVFGSVFYLLSAEELRKANRIAQTDELRHSLEGAAELVADPMSGSWVRKKWGEAYLEKEDVFYRMLVILGLTAYADMTQDRRYDAMVETQARGLSRELLAAPYHVLDDYPGECYPNDVIWAAAAINRVGALPIAERKELAQRITGSIAEQLSDRHGLPAMLVDAITGEIQQPSRGCSNSGLLGFAWELSPATAANWYSRYVESFWIDNHWLVGFREHPANSPATFADVDSGPILFGVGTVATAFGIGAARAAGRVDHAAPMTMEVLAGTWPTPFGLVVPGIMGWAAADSWVLGETALLFAMTRPNYRGQVTPFTGQPPIVVWGFVLFYVALGTIMVLREWRYWRRYRQANAVAA